jgi:hypothetical protein
MTSEKNNKQQTMNPNTVQLIFAIVDPIAAMIMGIGLMKFGRRMEYPVFVLLGKIACIAAPILLILGLIAVVIINLQH